MDQLGQTISYWQATLAEHRFVMSPSVVVIIESTIIYLQALLLSQSSNKPTDNSLRAYSIGGKNEATKGH